MRHEIPPSILGNVTEPLSAREKIANRLSDSPLTCENNIAGRTVPRNAASPNATHDLCLIKECRVRNQSQESDVGKLFTKKELEGLSHPEDLASSLKRRVGPIIWTMSCSLFRISLPLRSKTAILPRILEQSLPSSLTMSTS